MFQPSALVSQWTGDGVGEKTKMVARCDVFLAGDLWDGESENEQKLAAGFDTSCSQPNCHLSACPHYRGLVVFSLTVEVFQTLVSVVLDVHGLCYDPRHWVRVFAEDFYLEVGWSSPMVLLLVVPDEALFLVVELILPMLFSSGKNILTRLTMVTAAALLPVSWFAGRQLTAVLVINIVTLPTDATASVLVVNWAFCVATITRLRHIAAHQLSR